MRAVNRQAKTSRLEAGNFSYPTDQLPHAEIKITNILIFNYQNGEAIDRNYQVLVQFKNCHLSSG